MFDATKSLEENLALFHTACEAIDKDCAKILLDNVSRLRNSGDQAKDRAARAAFNAAVKVALDALPAEEAGV